MATELQRAPLDPRVLAEAADMVRVLGHPVRLRIVELLEAGELTVKEIQGALDAPQALVSQQLARMRGAGIVEGRRDGANVRYRIADSRVVRMLDCLRHCDLPAGQEIGTRSEA
jgi:DNA-binding transcriptional ArsR family regulator